MLTSLIQQSENYDVQKHDHWCPAQIVKFENDLTLTAMDSGKMVMTAWAWGQFSEKLGRETQGWAKALPLNYLLAVGQNHGPEIADVLNKCLADSRSVYLLRGYQAECRAVLSDNYIPLANTDLLKSVAEVVETEATPDLKLIRPSVTPDSLHLKLAWQDVSGGNYAIGVYVGNGETGNLKLRILPFVQKHACTNSILYNDGVELYHRGSIVNFLPQLKDAFIQCFKRSATVLDNLLAAEERKIPSFSDVLWGLSLQHRWDQTLFERILTGTNQRESVAGLVDGVTFAAQSISDPDAQIEMEILGGTLLAAPDSLFSRAAELAKSKKSELLRR